MRVLTLAIVLGLAAATPAAAQFPDLYARVSYAAGTQDVTYLTYDRQGPVPARVPKTAALQVVVDPVVQMAPHRRLTVTITNLSDAILCIPKDMFLDETSVMPVIEIRYRGRALKRYPMGFISPQESGFERLSPHMSKTLSFIIDGRFKFPTQKLFVGTNWQARVSINAYPCDHLRSDYVLNGQSPWVDIRPLISK